MKNKSWIDSIVMSRVRYFLPLIFSIFAFQFSSLQAQTRAVDSLLTRIKTDKQDTTKANDFKSLAWAYRTTGELKKAMDFSDSSIALSEKLNFRSGLGRCYNIRASIYYIQGDYPNALNYLLKSLQIAESMNDRGRVASCNDNIGLIYKQQGDNAKALEYYNKALQTDEELKDTVSIESVLNNMGAMLEIMHDTAGAMKCFQRIMKINKTIGDKATLALTAANIGNVYYDEKDYARAMQYYQDGLKLDEELGDKSAMAVANLNIGYVYLTQKKYKDAEAYTQKCLEIAKSIGDLERIKGAEDNLAVIYANTGEWEKALQARKQYNYMKDSLVNEAKSKQLGKLEAKAQYDKDLALQKADEDKKAALAAADSKRQKVLILLVAAIALAIACIAFIIARSLRTARAQKAEIEIQTEEVEKQKTVVEEKNQEIMDSINYAKRLQEAILPPLSDIKKFFPESFVIYKPKDIVSGDFYWLASPPSKGGNEASLPSEGGINTASSENTNLVHSSPLGSGGAVLNPPLEGREAGPLFIAAADCTGHGVPGALVSVVCSNALNRAVKEFGITEPGKVLDKVRELVLETFEKSIGNVQDGMDISLLTITASPPSKGGINTASSENTNSAHSSPLGSGGALTVSWAGAYNPLLYVQNGELKEIAPDKQPIGKTDNPKPFTTHSITIPIGSPMGSGGAGLNPPLEGREATTFYLFTDGYADQFGGPKGKKFKYKQLQEKLLQISDKPMAEQGKILEKTFEKWMGFVDQVDDVLMIGIRV